MGVDTLSPIVGQARDCQSSVFQNIQFALSSCHLHSVYVHQDVVTFRGQLIPPSTESGFCCMQRRYALEDWLGRLLADIIISRSAPMTSFLELEAATRFGKQTAQMLCILLR